MDSITPEVVFWVLILLVIAYWIVWAWFSRRDE